MVERWAKQQLELIPNARAAAESLGADAVATDAYATKMLTTSNPLVDREHGKQNEQVPVNDPGRGVARDALEKMTADMGTIPETARNARAAFDRIQDVLREGKGPLTAAETQQRETEWKKFGAQVLAESGPEAMLARLERMEQLAARLDKALAVSLSNSKKPEERSLASAGGANVPTDMVPAEVKKELRAIHAKELEVDVNMGVNPTNDSRFYMIAEQTLKDNPSNRGLLSEAVLGVEAPEITIKERDIRDVRTEARNKVGAVSDELSTVARTLPDRAAELREQRMGPDQQVLPIELEQREQQTRKLIEPTAEYVTTYVDHAGIEGTKQFDKAATITGATPNNVRDQRLSADEIAAKAEDLHSPEKREAAKDRIIAQAADNLQGGAAATAAAPKKPAPAAPTLTVNEAFDRTNTRNMGRWNENSLANGQTSVDFNQLGANEGDKTHYITSGSTNRLDIKLSAQDVVVDKSVLQNGATINLDDSAGKHAKAGIMLNHGDTLDVKAAKDGVVVTIKEEANGATKEINIKGVSVAKLDEKISFGRRAAAGSGQTYEGMVSLASIKNEQAGRASGIGEGLAAGASVKGLVVDASVRQTDNRVIYTERKDAGGNDVLLDLTKGADGKLSINGGAMAQGTLVTMREESGEVRMMKVGSDGHSLEAYNRQQVLDVARMATSKPKLEGQIVQLNQFGQQTGGVVDIKDIGNGKGQVAGVTVANHDYMMRNKQGDIQKVHVNFDGSVNLVPPPPTPGTPGGTMVAQNQNGR